MAKWKTTEAEVVDNIYVPTDFASIKFKDRVNDETATYYAVIAFRTDKSEIITKQLDFGGSSPRPIGSRMKVIYDPNKPTDLVVHPKAYLRVLPWILMIAGLTGLMLSLVIYWGN